MAPSMVVKIQFLDIEMGGRRAGLFVAPALLHLK
jgi:hypothetical protein